MNPETLRMFIEALPELDLDWHQDRQLIWWECFARLMREATQPQFVTS